MKPQMYMLNGRRGEQATNNITMVWSPGFQSNDQTLSTNFAQTGGSALSESERRELVEAAYKEFLNVKTSLEQLGVNVTVLEGPEGSPDAIFPNNTFSSHPAVNMGGVSTTVFYPMLAENRHAELTPERQRALKESHNRVIDMRSYRDEGRYLEGTGSLVLDRVNKIAYASRSPRTDEGLVRHWAKELGYKPVVFDAKDGQDNDVYHTNVVMWVGTAVAGVCLDAIPDPKARDEVKTKLQTSGKIVLELTKEQMDAPNFSGNALEVLNRNGEPVLAMSEAAWNAYTDEQREVLQSIYGSNITTPPIPTIEKNGGGSVRCMLAEEFVVAAGEREAIRPGSSFDLDDQAPAV